MHRLWDSAHYPSAPPFPCMGSSLELLGCAVAILPPLLPQAHGVKVGRLELWNCFLWPCAPGQLFGHGVGDAAVPAVLAVVPQEQVSQCDPVGSTGCLEFLSSLAPSQWDSAPRAEEEAAVCSRHCLDPAGAHLQCIPNFFYPFLLFP